MRVSFCLPHPVAVSAFMIRRGLSACTEMWWMCVLYVSFGSKVRPRTFGCVAMGSALLFIVNCWVQIARVFCRVWCEQRASCFVWIYSAVTVECYVLYPCCMGGLGMFAVM